MSLDLSSCTVCPRACGANRLAGEKGVCAVTGEKVIVSRAALHFFEEPCISGTAGSGAVFFAGCNLRCIYCQNYEISAKPKGIAVSVQELSDIFLRLQDKGALNINLVTPSHYATAIAAALIRAKENGLTVPVVYNCSGYESVEALEMLAPLVDIYLTDYKYEDAELAERFSRAKDYPAVAKKALSRMIKSRPECVFSEDGRMLRGVIVRVLLLPGHVRNSKDVVSYVYGTYGDGVYLSLMNQYTPMREFPEAPELSRKVTRGEYERLLDHALALGVKNAFMQEGGTEKKSFIPAFDGEGVLPE